MTDRLRVKVVTPTRVVVDTEVDEVSLPGALGTLGILPGHAPLLSALRIGELAYRVGSRESYLAIQWGFVEVSRNQVTVLANVAEKPGEIDIAAAREAKAGAEAALKTAAGPEFDRQRAALEAAVTRIAVAGRS
jgi:F-type H+-transporting ATPase subunit epsilon